VLLLGENQELGALFEARSINKGRMHLFNAEARSLNLLFEKNEARKRRV
jgi:hypothetical protein